MSTSSAAHLHYTPKPAACRRHLLVELRALREARRLAEVVGDEHFRASLRGPSEQLGAVDLDEALVTSSGDTSSSTSGSRGKADGAPISIPRTR